MAIPISVSYDGRDRRAIWLVEKTQRIDDRWREKQQAEWNQAGVPQINPDEQRFCLCLQVMCGLRCILRERSLYRSWNTTNFSAVATAIFLRIDQSMNSQSKKKALPWKDGQNVICWISSRASFSLDRYLSWFRMQKKIDYSSNPLRPWRNHPCPKKQFFFDRSRILILRERKWEENEKNFDSSYRWIAVKWDFSTNTSLIILVRATGAASHKIYSPPPKRILRK